MNPINLRHLTNHDQSEFEKAYRGFAKERDFEFVPSNQYQPSASFEHFLKLLAKQERGENLPPGFVAATWLFAFNDSGVIVGRVSIRHTLNDYLLKIGGHVGYGVLPEFRKLGYASEILKQTLSYCKNKLALTKILLTCDDNNQGSIRTIEKNGGILENTILSSSNVLKRRYWINQ